MKKIITLGLLLLCFTKMPFAQNVGIGTTTPDKSAVLELSSINKGFLPPQMSATQKGQIQTPKKGLMIYQTDGAAGLYIFNGSTWMAVASLVNTWNVNGNTGTDPINNFIGTIDAQPLVFRAGNKYAGRIGSNGMVAMGTGAAAVLSDESIVAIGKNALLNNGTGATGYQGKSNTAIGYETLKANTTGLSNTATGAAALSNNTTGDENTASGQAALYANIIGNYNTAFGNRALSQNKADNNTAIGNLSLASNNTGSDNTATGYHSLSYNTDGNSNVANGNFALAENNNGSYNTALGYSSLEKNKSSRNTAIGNNALNKNINGSSNTATGYAALFANIGFYNTANGADALATNTTGDGNTAVGLNSLSTNTTGSNNVGIGYSANVSSNNLSYATAVGAGAIVGCTGCLVLGSPTVKVGIGLSSPGAPLHVNQNFKNLGLRLTYGAWDWDIYTSSGGGLNFNYNGVNKSYISSIDGSYIATSDARLKKDVNKMGDVLNRVMALQPKTYKYISNKETDRKSNGFLAQEVMPLFPELVSDFQHPTKDTTDNTIYHGINYAGFGVIAIKAIQEQQQLINTQQKEIELLKEQMKLILAVEDKFKK